MDPKRKKTSNQEARSKLTTCNNEIKLKRNKKRIEAVDEKIKSMGTICKKLEVMKKERDNMGLSIFRPI